MGDPEADIDNEVLKFEQDSQVLFSFRVMKIVSLKMLDRLTEFVFVFVYNQVGRGSRGDVTILPTLVINDAQYRGRPFHHFFDGLGTMFNILLLFFVHFIGKLERTAVLRAICSGFKETADPAICLSGGIT